MLQPSGGRQEPSSGGSRRPGAGVPRVDDRGRRRYTPRDELPDPDATDRSGHAPARDDALAVRAPRPPAPAAADPGPEETVTSRALVTGGAVRVGRAIALELGRAGFDVVVHYHSSGDEAERTVAALRGLGREAVSLRADLRDPGEIGSLFREVASRWGRLDLLVNSAAAFPRGRPEDVDPAGWDALFALNARAPLLCAREAAELMGEEGGAVVNIADVAAFEAWPGYVAYAATKAALVSLTRSLALAWAPRVRVNAVAPGPVLLPEGSPDEERRAAALRTALGRVGRPEDVAGAVLYLARAPYVTGEVVRVDGGAHLRRTSEGWRPRRDVPSG